MPRGSAPFWWSLVGFISLALMQVVFWTVTQPVNRHWTANLNLSSSARHFFRVEQKQSGSAELPQRGQWERLRNRWEYSHIVRAVFATTSLVCVTVAIVLYGQSGAS
jgi:hypothetical protein